ncbi:hypothetical protein [Hymenobacter cellulosilyticus]|uniref:Leucine-rich repeat domain-containing protein n=1 Tax=Hymenobacter cellulosilyticus TaxID=2932248 RepID=A0A8T9QFK1_9BACT|nr:hypothetical protein [Hymenobacter cellulosilyticus]UOQ75191.1 hypothetical protein MUN79_28800 [Hymenobacter cellulosilyticus]
MPLPLRSLSQLFAVKLLCIVFLLLPASARAQVPAGEGEVADADEIAALRALYLATDGGNNLWSNHSYWPSRAQWLSSPITTFTLEQAKNWYGVTVRYGDVVELRLQNNHLQGSLPESVTTLTRLEHLQLKGNALTGRLPQNLQRFDAIKYFDVSHNQLTGALPPALGSMSPAYYIILNNNQFEGFLLDWMENLKECILFDASYNRLTGVLPEAIGRMPYLSDCYLNDNDFYGEVPSKIASSTSYLNRLVVSHNRLEGKLPASLTSLPHIWLLKFSDNHLTEIPCWIPTTTPRPKQKMFQCLVSMSVAIIWILVRSNPISVARDNR